MLVDVAEHLWQNTPLCFAVSGFGKNVLRYRAYNITLESRLCAIVWWWEENSGEARSRFRWEEKAQLSEISGQYLFFAPKHQLFAHLSFHWENNWDDILPEKHLGNSIYIPNSHDNKRQVVNQNLNTKL